VAYGAVRLLLISWARAIENSTSRDLRIEITYMQVVVKALVGFVVTVILILAIMLMLGWIGSYSPTEIFDFNYVSNPILLASALILILLVVGLTVYSLHRYRNRLHSAEKELEQQAKLLKHTESRLVLANSEIKEAQDNFVRNTTRIKLSVSRLFSSDGKPKDVSLLDITKVSKLQEIQDSIDKVFGTGSVIVDHSGEKLTRDQNRSAACALMKSSPEGAKECYWHQRNLGEKSFKNRQPVYKKCKSCGLMCGGVPFIVNDRHVATWIIGQVMIDNEISFDLSASSCKLGIVPATLLKALELVPKISISKFRSILELVWLFAQEFGELAFNNTSLISEVINLKKQTPKLQLAQRALDRIELGVLMINPHGRIVAASEAACLRLNQSYEELIPP